jgi:hypothetical protein
MALESYSRQILGFETILDECSALAPRVAALLQPEHSRHLHKRRDTCHDTFTVGLLVLVVNRLFPTSLTTVAREKLP